MRSPTQMSATVVTKIGPVKAKFSGEVTLENINAPAGYTIVRRGQGRHCRICQGRRGCGA
ncbi:MAG: SRPBCC domain-containing protein [Nitratireductor sp.]